MFSEMFALCLIEYKLHYLYMIYEGNQSLCGSETVSSVVLLHVSTPGWTCNSTENKSLPHPCEGAGEGSLKRFGALSTTVPVAASSVELGTHGAVSGMWEADCVYPANTQNMTLTRFEAVRARIPERGINKPARASGGGACLLKSCDIGRKRAHRVTGSPNLGFLQPSQWAVDWKCERRISTWETKSKVGMCVIARLSDPTRRPAFL